MTAVVLVHGAFHGGWCWRDVAGPLREAGHTVFTPTLTGLGERSNLLAKSVDLDVHIEDVINVIRYEELDDVVLVAHSYGGMPVTGAADALADRLRALVYLDAFTPEDGDSAMAVRSAVPGFVPLAEPADGVSVAPPSARVFGLDGALAEWVERRMTPHPVATMTQPIRLTGAWRGVPRKLYIRTAQYPAPYFDTYYDQAEADPDWRAVRRDAPHNIMMSEPDWFIGLLQEHAF